MKIEKWFELLINGAGIGLGIALGSAVGTIISKWLTSQGLGVTKEAYDYDYNSTGYGSDDPAGDHY